MLAVFAPASRSKLKETDDLRCALSWHSNSANPKADGQAQLVRDVGEELSQSGGPGTTEDDLGWSLFEYASLVHEYRPV
jgi:hypothetical protein